MNGNLQRLFRLAETRLHESDRLGELSGRGPSQRVLRRRARFYQFLAELPLWLRPREGVYIPNMGSPVGKAAIAARELREAAPADAGNLISSNVPRWAPKLHRAARVLVRVPRAWLVASWLQWKHPGLSRYRRSVLVGLDATRRFLQRNPGLHPLVISDVSPLLAVLALAAQREGNCGIWWQDDYDHTWSPPFPFGFGCFLNQVAMENAVAAGRVVRAFRRPVPEPRPVRLPGPKLAVGVAVNAFFGGTAKEWRVLQELREALQVDMLHLRLHPNANLVDSAVPMSWVQIADRSETMEAFARRIDLAVVGNSASQLRLLIEGVPVLHLGGLDPLEYDDYGYVEFGLLPGADCVSRVSIEAIREFYDLPGYFEGLLRRVGFATDCHQADLPSLVSALFARGGSGAPTRAP